MCGEPGPARAEHDDIYNFGNGEGKIGYYVDVLDEEDSWLQRLVVVEHISSDLSAFSAFPLAHMTI